MLEDDDPEPESSHVQKPPRARSREVEHEGILSWSQPNYTDFAVAFRNQSHPIDLQVACEPGEQVNSCIFKSFASTPDKNTQDRLPQA